MQTTLGGDRLGSGNKQKISLHEYSRSTHDLSYVFRSTMAAGTLVPFMSELALPGDSFDIDLECDIKTHPTIGPLFGSYKVQLDIFQCPIRLYNGKLHMNMLNIGLNMSQIKLPQLQMSAKVEQKFGDNAQINPSSIFKYLGISGIGQPVSTEQELLQRNFNAIPYLSYFDIYKNYYANKQEEFGAIIHNPQNTDDNTIGNFKFNDSVSGNQTLTDDTTGASEIFVYFYWDTIATIDFNLAQPIEVDQIYITTMTGPPDSVAYQTWPITKFFTSLVYNEGTGQLVCSNPTDWATSQVAIMLGYYKYDVLSPDQNKPKISLFPLENIDKMRENILVDTLSATPFLVNEFSPQPYNLPFVEGDSGLYSKQSTQEGLLLKTYQSDLFNNWVSTEWIDGDSGINALTSVDTSEGYFTIDSLQLSKKVYDMLNRIAVSGGTYDDWLDAVYTHERTRSVENPIYQGGLSKELIFQEVVSNAASETKDGVQPLGQLAGRGNLSQKHKGGKVRVKVDEPSYIIGIVSLTPRVDYSQGNKWDVNLQTMDDLHKPALDEIGFQDLITDQMAWWDTKIDGTGTKILKSAGKQPAWVNYMTNVNKCYGNFAVKEGDSTIEGGQMYMTLNRRYEQDENGIIDQTTYIDPKKFNNIFADTRIDAQNFWTQIGVNITARRKMSAKLMPNL